MFLPVRPQLFPGFFKGTSHSFLLSQNMKVFWGNYSKPVSGYSFSFLTYFVQLQWAYLCPCGDVLAISPAHVHIDLGERKIAHADSCQLSDLTSIVLVIRYFDGTSKYLHSNYAFVR